MSSNTIFSSIESQKRWVLAMEKNFPQEHIVDINFFTPTSIFKIPKTLTETNPEAYTPQHLGLGPYHHLRPELYPMQKPKVAAVNNYLKSKNPKSFQKVVDALVQFEPLLRQCYDQYLDLDIQTLAWILTIDGLYLLQFLENYSQNNSEELNTGDIMMLENQIPVIILKSIRQALQICQDEVDYLLFNQFHRFCEVKSPLKLNEEFPVLKDRSQMHMLHRMYYLIVNNRGIKDSDNRMFMFEDSLPISLDDFNVAAQFVAKQVSGASAVGDILSFMGKVPWDKILTLFKKGGGGSDKKNILVEEIDIPKLQLRVELIMRVHFRASLSSLRVIPNHKVVSPEH
ncbi:hypothetical protein ACJIZ3_014323 [Penstemon smallii]|uniref:Uncharacterized protein n=1 Tax=Penstemon smallii TaxID=265156 RepID=A0ABD3RJF7_9LAMI